MWYTVKCFLVVNPSCIIIIIIIIVFIFIFQSHEKSYSCETCGKSFARKDTLARHQKVHAKPTNVETKAKENIDSQEPPVKRVKIMEQYECNICGASFETVQQLRNHFSIHQDENKEEEYDPSNEAKDDDDPLIQKALGNALKVITFQPQGQEKVNPLQLFSNRKEDITKYLEDATQRRSGIKWHMSCAIKFVKYDKEGNEIDTVAFFTCRCVTKLPQDNEEILNLSIDQAYNKMFVDCQEFQREGSGWAIDEVLYVKLMMEKYVPLKGSQYVDLPPKVKNSKAVINIQNDDDKCFLWSVLAHLYEANHNRQRTEHYIPYETEINMNGITYPVAVKDVPKFEKENDISVNVFGYEDGYYPLYISRNQKEKHVNLLLIEKGGKTHYCLITDLNKMLHSQAKYHGRKFFCTLLSTWIYQERSKLSATEEMMWWNTFLMI